jgi:hypothetical protein
MVVGLIEGQTYGKSRIEEQARMWIRKKKGKGKDILVDDKGYTKERDGTRPRM